MFRLVVIALLGGNPVHVWRTGHIFTADLTCEQAKEYYEDEIVRRVRALLKAPAEVVTRCIKVGDIS